MKILWIDLLCFKTIFIVCFRRKIEFDRIHFINSHKFFNPFIGIVSKIIKKPLIHINYVVEAEEYIYDSSLYETIQTRINKLLDSWIKSKDVNKKIIKFIGKTGFSFSKYSAYLKENAYHFAFRQIEIYSISEATSKDNINSFLLKKTPLSDEIKLFFQPQPVDFYSYSGYLILKRNNYYYDSKINNIYYRGNLIPSSKLLINWFTISLSSVFKTKNSKKNNSLKIGVELIQTKVRLDFVNDFYWLKNSDINPNTVVGLTTINYDLKSYKEIAKSGIKVFNVSGNIFKAIVHKIRFYGLNHQPKFIFVDTD